MPLPETVSELEPYELIFAIESLDNTPITHDMVKEYTDRDQNLTQLKLFIKHGCPHTIKNKELSQYKTHIRHMSIMKGCILFHNRVLIPLNLRSRVLNVFHSDHPGIVAMESLARSLIWYPGLDSDIENLVKACKVCQSVRNRPAQNSHVTWPTPSRPWQRLHGDHFFMRIKLV